MKINGIKFDGPAEEVLVIPMGLAGDMVFKIKCVVDYSEFEKMVKEPVPPMILRRGQTVSTPNFDDPKYKKETAEYILKQTQYMILKSLDGTEGLVWDTVKLTNPETWADYEKELKAAGLGDIHIGRIIKAISEVNGLSDKKMEEAKQRFLAMKLLQKEQNFQAEEASSLQSGDVVKDLA